MEKLDSYIVDLKGMTADTVSYEWQAEDDFFSAVQGPEIQHGQLNVALRVKRTSGAYELVFQLDGSVEVTCDRCLEMMDQPIHATHTLQAKLGDANDDDGEIITVAEDEGTLSVAWYIYEIAALHIPLRHVHPDGECAPQMAEAFSQCDAEAENTQEIDPRWSELKKLLDNNK